MLRWLILGLITIVATIVGTFAVRFPPPPLNCRSYMATVDLPPGRGPLAVVPGVEDVATA